jgi:hypothetical protein
MRVSSIIWNEAQKAEVNSGSVALSVSSAASHTGRDSQIKFQ